MRKLPGVGVLAAAIALAIFLPACASTKKTSSAEVLLNARMAAVLLREGRAVEAERAYRDVLPHDSKNAENHAKSPSSLTPLK